jgi:hypothetical protein
MRGGESRHSNLSERVECCQRNSLRGTANAKALRQSRKVLNQQRDSLHLNLPEKLLIFLNLASARLGVFAVNDY